MKKIFFTMVMVLMMVCSCASAKEYVDDVGITFVYADLVSVTHYNEIPNIDRNGGTDVDDFQALFYDKDTGTAYILLHGYANYPDNATATAFIQKKILGDMAAHPEYKAKAEPILKQAKQLKIICCNGQAVNDVPFSEIYGLPMTCISRLAPNESIVTFLFQQYGLVFAGDRWATAFGLGVMQCEADKMFFVHKKKV